jgi:hypothetical protein
MLTDKEYKRHTFMWLYSFLKDTAMDDGFPPDIMTGDNSWFQHLDLKKRQE